MRNLELLTVNVATEDLKPSARLCLAESKPKRRKLFGALRIVAWFWFCSPAPWLWCRWVYVQIESYAHQDQAAPADAIGVLGAAEYDGRPSPVYRARLDHALELYHRGIAPLIITLGGPGGDHTPRARSARIPDQQGRSRRSHHCRDREPQHRGVGAAHRRDRARQRPAPAGGRQRRHAHVPHSRHLRRRRARRADFAAPAAGRRRQDAGGRAHRATKF